MLEEAQRSADLLEMQLRTMSEQFEHSLNLLGVKDGEIKSLEEARAHIQVEVEELAGELDVERHRFEEEVEKRRSAEKLAGKWKSWAGQAISDTNGLRQKIGRLVALIRPALTILQSTKIGG